MKSPFNLTVLACSALLLSGCQNFDSADGIQSGMLALKAATLNDADVRQLTEQACAEADEQNTIAAAGTPYEKRLKRIAQALGNQIDGVPLNYKVYITKDVNAWAMANGCIRVYSGLMDQMSNNEIEGVLGHEMGHVALGHTRKALQTAYAAAALRGAAASSNNATVSSLSDSQLGKLTESLINAQFSQSQEAAADDFSYDLLKQRKINVQGLASAFDKLAKMDNGQQSGLFSSHPGSQARAEHIRQRIAQDKR